jgi:hypothetical protein
MNAGLIIVFIKNMDMLSEEKRLLQKFAVQKESGQVAFLRHVTARTLLLLYFRGIVILQFLKIMWRIFYVLRCNLGKLW